MLYIIGDTDQNGKLTVNDVTVLQRHLVEFEILSGNALKAADTNGDGRVTIDDATLLQLYLAEYNVTLG